VICDSSRALLIAVIRAFTEYLNIEDYADTYKNSNLSKCYIRINVAFFKKVFQLFQIIEQKSKNILCWCNRSTNFV